MNKKNQVCKNRKEGFKKIEKYNAMDHFKLSEYIQSSSRMAVYPYWGNDKLFYCEGVKFLINKLNCPWLIDEIDRLVLSRVLASASDDGLPSWCCADKIELVAYPDHTAVLTATNEWSDDEPWLQHKMNKVDLPVLKAPFKFCLCEFGEDIYSLSIA